MNIELRYLLGVASLIAGVINLAYFIKHANGKKHIRLLSAIVLGNYGVYLITDGPKTDLLLLTLFLLPVLDTITDWRTKLIRTKGR